MDEDLIKKLDLFSPKSFGIFDHSVFSPTRDWQEECHQRQSDFSNVPLIVDKFDEPIKRKMRNGVPSKLRRSIWFQATGGYKLMKDNPSSWEAIINVSKKQLTSDAEGFGSTQEIFSFLPQKAANTLKDFLHVIWVQNKTITFAPTISSTAAILLMYMEPPLAYYSIQAMINKKKWYFTETRPEFIASAESVEVQCKRLCHDVVIHAETLGISIAQTVMSLFPTFFLPFATLPVALTFFDSFVLEGRKIFLRLCLGIFLQERAVLKKTKTVDEFYSTLLNAVSNINNPERAKDLLKKSFNLYISRERHIIPSEQQCIENKTGLMGARSIVDSPTVQQMFQADIGNIYGIKNSHTGSGPNRLGHCVNERRMSYSAVISESLGSAFHPCDPFLHGLPTFTASTELTAVAPAVVGSAFLADSIYYRLREYLPAHLRSYSPVKVFGLSEDGASLSTLMNKAYMGYPHLLAIKTEHGIMGAFLSDPPRPFQRGKFHGAPTCFVFTSNSTSSSSSPINLSSSSENLSTQTSIKKDKREIDNGPIVFRAAGNGMYLSFDFKALIIGGPKPALYIDNEMQRVWSEASEAFGSPRLTGEQDNQNILDVELFKLVLRPHFTTK